ncbi:hypothetical protein F5B19DRAFT_490891, partial [Rostrohypoxylon terebratum]
FFPASCGPQLTGSQLDRALAEDARELYSEIHAERPSRNRVSLLQHRCLVEIQRQEDFLALSVPQRVEYDTRMAKERAERNMAARKSIADALDEVNLTLTPFKRDSRRVADRLGTLTEQAVRSADAQGAAVASIYNLRKAFSGLRLPAVAPSPSTPGGSALGAATRRGGGAVLNWGAPSAH